METEKCQRCNGTGKLQECLRCKVVYRHIHKYSDCGSIGCDGEMSKTVPCTECRNETGGATKRKIG